MVIDLFGPGGSLLTFFQCYRWTPKPDLRSPSFLLIPKYHKYTCFESVKVFGNFLIVLLYFYVYLAKFSSRSIGGKDFLHYFCKTWVSMSPLSMVRCCSIVPSAKNDLGGILVHIYIGCRTMY